MPSFTLNKLLLGIALAIFAFATLGCDNKATSSRQQPQIPVSDIRSCDLVFRLGRSVESAIIAADGNYSHIGVVISNDSCMRVAHIEPSREGDERTKFESLEEFFHTDRASAGCVMRFVELDSMQCQQIENFLLSCSEVSFDHDYVLSGSAQMYCTELVWRAFLTAGVDLSMGVRRKLPLAKEGVILPSDISSNEVLKEVWSY